MIAQVVLALAPLAVVPARAVSDDPLAPLVAKTNALQAFTARYRMTNHKGEQSELTLSYAAPDRSAITIDRAGQRSNLWSVRGAMFMQFDDGSGRTLYGRIDVKSVVQECEEITAALREHFPGAPARKEAPLGPGVYLDIGWDSPKAAGEPQIDINTGFELRRTHLCHWLWRLDRLDAEPRAEGELLLWDVADSTTVSLSTASGFLVRIARNKAGVTTGLELLSLDVDSEPDDARFAPPESAPEGARIVSDDMLHQLRRQQLSNVRGILWETLPRWIAAHEVSWEKDSPAELTAVFRVLHSKLVVEYSADFIEGLRDRIDAFAVELEAKAKSLAKDDEAAWSELASGRDRWLADMNGALDRAAEKGAQTIVPPRVEGLAAELSAAMLEAERAATRAEFDAKLREPLVAYFRDRTDAVMAGR
jgi:hypothetical protein